MASSGAPPHRMSVPVVTDATAATPGELAEAAAHFVGAAAAAAATFTRCSGGVNNKLYYVDAPGAARRVLRIYNNGGNLARVLYEHEVLRQLRGAALPFALPTPLAAVGADGATHARLASGACACMFELIPGGAAPLSAARAIGAATARLVAASAAVRVPPAFGAPNPLYRNLFDAHHASSRGAFFALVAADPAFAPPAVRAPTDALLAEIARAEALIAGVLAAGDLPEQQLHADLHFDNVLVGDDGAVTGVLDFEFSAEDWRAMEVAVGLSKFCGLEAPEAHVEAYVAGYADGGGALTRREAQLMPDLIIIRILSNVIYFGGRAIAGEDDVAALAGRADVYARRVRWLHDRRAWLVGVLEAALVRGS